MPKLERKWKDVMNLCEAVRKAFETDAFITVPEFRNSAKIKPTNERGLCIVSNWDGSNPSKTGWQPSADDFLRDDWEVVKGEC